MRKKYTILLLLLLLSALLCCKNSSDDEKTTVTEQPSLVGEWRNRSTVNTDKRIIEFNEDGTFSLYYYINYFYEKMRGTYSYGENKITLMLTHKDTGSGLEDISDKKETIVETSVFDGDIFVLMLEVPNLFVGGDTATLQGTWSYFYSYSATINGTTNSITMNSDIVLGEDGSFSYTTLITYPNQPEQTQTTTGNWSADTVNQTMTITNTGTIDSTGPYLIIGNTLFTGSESAAAQYIYDRQ